jgi:hypothetical protein
LEVKIFPPERREMGKDAADEVLDTLLKLRTIRVLYD